MASLVRFTEVRSMSQVEADMTSGQSAQHEAGECRILRQSMHQPHHEDLKHYQHISQACADVLFTFTVYSPQAWRTTAQMYRVRTLKQFSESLTGASRCEGSSNAFALHTQENKSPILLSEQATAIVAAALP